MKRLTTLLAAATLAGSGPAFAQAKDIKIAHVYDKTGALEAYAKQTQAGLMMGLEYATGGTMSVLGRKIVVIEKDNQLKPDVGKCAARRRLRRRQGRPRDRADRLGRRRWRCCRWPRNTRRSCWSSRRSPTRSPATSGTATSSAPGAIRRRTRSRTRSRSGERADRDAGAGLRLRPRRREGVQGSARRRSAARRPSCTRNTRRRRPPTSPRRRSACSTR